MEEMYELIPQLEDTWAGIKTASDYDECRIEVIGRKEYDEDKIEPEDFLLRNRIPSANEVTKIIEDYKGSNLSLYELADRYDLQINNLFRLLKETGMIEKETDAKGYDNFYTEYLGTGCDWDGKNVLGLI